MPPVKPNPSPFTPGSHIVAYLRDSGHENQELSTIQQQDSIRRYCQENQLILQRAYIDAERQGSSDRNRDQLAEMMHDLRHGLDVSGVIVWSNARFARNSLHAQFYRAEIRKLGYKFYSMTGTTVEGPESIIFEALEDYKNERYLKDLSIETKRGLHAIVRDYGCVPGVPPVGFKREEVIIAQHRDGKPRIGHRWVVDENVAPRVLSAFRLRLAGYTLSAINTETHLFSSVNSFRTFFSNPLYKGVLVYGDLVINDYCPPVVDALTWTNVQKIQGDYAHRTHLKDDSLHPRRANSKYMLSGLLRCARCGSPMFGRTHPQKNGKTTTSYYCGQAYRERNCTKHRIPGALVEKEILKLLQTSWLNVDTLNRIAEMDNERQAGQTGETLARRRELSAELGEIRRQITNITDALADVGKSSSLLTRLARLEDQETTLANKIADLDSRTAAPIQRMTSVQIQRLLGSLHLLPQMDLQSQHLMLRGLIDHIDVDRDGRRIFVSLTLYYPPDDETYILPPTDSTSGGQYVRISRTPSGPPRYTHIIDFSETIMGLAGRHKLLTE